VYYLAEEEDDDGGLGENAPLLNIAPAKGEGMSFFSFLPSIVGAAIPGLTKLIPDKAAIAAAKVEKLRIKTAKELEQARFEQEQRKRQFWTFGLLAAGAIIVGGVLVWGAVRK
jgi:hypothetical protein